MEIIQFDLTGKGQPDIADTVYESLHGFLLPACQLPWVDVVFVPGHPAYDAYERMQSAYARLRQRLGVVDEDPDAEEMIDALLAYSKHMGVEMFHCGIKFKELQG